MFAVSCSASTGTQPSPLARPCKDLTPLLQQLRATLYARIFPHNKRAPQGPTDAWRPPHTKPATHPETPATGNTARSGRYPPKPAITNTPARSTRWPAQAIAYNSGLTPEAMTTLPSSGPSRSDHRGPDRCEVEHPLGDEAVLNVGDRDGPVSHVLGPRASTCAPAQGTTCSPLTADGRAQIRPGS